MSRPICRHCANPNRTVNRPRGLCWNCYYAPGVRDLYPSTSKYARRGVGNIAGGLRLPDAPTHTVPGSEDRIVVLEERARNHQSLFHPRDARFGGVASGDRLGLSIYRLSRGDHAGLLRYLEFE